MLTDEERQIVEHGTAAGKSKKDVANAIAKYRKGSTAAASATPAPKPGLFSEQGAVGKVARKVTDFLGLSKAADVLGTVAAREGFGPQTREEGLNVAPVSNRQVIGAALQTTAAGASPALGGSGTLAAKIGSGLAGGYAYDIGQDLAEDKSDAEAALPGAAALVGSLGPLGGPAAKGAGKAVGKAATEAGKVVTHSPVVKAGLQGAIEFGERVPRFVSKRVVDIRDAATRAERIATAPKPIGNALKAGVDERIINTIEQADEPTRKGFGDIIRLAEESISTTGTIKQKTRPEIIAGDAAAQQYKLIDDQRKKIGKAIGDATKALSRDTQVPMAQSYEVLDDQLREIGVDVTYNEGGAVLNFGKTGFTKAQRAKINELYELATEGGDNLSPFQIHDKDRLFSQLQREARMEGIGDIVVETVNGPTSLFSIFRDVYSETLENVAPDIKPLNKQYRNLRTFVDDIEGTIIKGGKFETNSAVDPAEFAQTNLRRLFSEAGSAADYRAIAEEMDAASRALGYQGATPADLAQFAYEIRKIYPETTPRTGFEGSIKGVMDIAAHVMKAGKADLTDQQKALRELIESLQQQTK